MAYYIEAADGRVLELNATTNVTENLTAKPTSNPVQSGKSITDHYTIENDTFSLSGVITRSLSTNDPFAYGPESDPEKYRTVVREVMESKQPFTLHLEDRAVDNCLFTSVVYIKTVVEGDGYGVTLQISRVSFTEESSTGTINLPTSIQDSLSNKDGSDSGSTTDVGNQTVLKDTTDFLR
jgi:hypothetical protein